MTQEYANRIIDIKLTRNEASTLLLTLINADRKTISKECAEKLDKLYDLVKFQVDHFDIVNYQEVI